jgi:hypothetical protein
MSVMIHTLKFARKFETAGFATAQAEALTAALAEMNSDQREDLVTKSDLRVALAEMKGDLKADISGLRAEMVSLNASSRSQILWALFGSQVFVIAAVAALSNFAKFFS